jgi:hypothetical protein
MASDSSAPAALQNDGDKERRHPERAEIYALIYYNIHGYTLKYMDIH